jgi:2'-5' RNA ligase
MRAFVALPLPDDTADLLHRRAQGAGVGRVPDTLHLTLAFLGEQPEAALAALAGELDLIVAPAPRLDWDAPEFLGGDRARVLALMVRPDPALMHLHARVRTAIRAAGLALPPDRFRPHVTLIRLPPRPGPGTADRLQALIGRGISADIPPVTASRLVLYHSRLDRAGARHDELAIWPLGEVTGRGLDLGIDPGHDRDPGAPPARRRSRR